MAHNVLRGGKQLKKLIESKKRVSQKSVFNFETPFLAGKERIRFCPVFKP
jgi:hypothetical protein